MKNLNLIAEELFNKIRGRFPSVTIGDVNGKVTNRPSDARFFDFDYKEGSTNLGKVSINVTEEAIEVMYSDNFVGEQDELTQQKWYDFLKELRQFSKKRLLKFDTRNINKSNLDRRDYEFLASNRGDNTMSESKLYGTNKISYQKIGEARIMIKHTENVNPELGIKRTRNIGKIYIESADGERFLYPYKHLTGARAMARHVAEGGKPHDDFGTHIVSLSEEMNKLRKFKSYMGRSAVMAESLKGYMPVVQDRIATVRKTIESLQKPNFYKKAFESFEKPMMEEVPSDVAENWIDQLTIKQFNEELKDVFPYIYNLVSEATKATELGPEDMLEGPIDFIKDKYADFKKGREESMAQYKQDLHILRTVLGSHGYDDATIKKIEGGCLNDPRVCLYNTIRKSGAKTGDMDVEVDRIGKELNSGLTTFAGTVDEQRIEDAFESLMGQFAEDTLDEGYMKGYSKYHCEDCGCQMHNCKPDCDCSHDSHDETGSWWKDANGNGVPDGLEKSMSEDKSEEFKPHMMYDPKTGKGKMANKEQDHKDLAKKGWGHDKPKAKDIEDKDVKEASGYCDCDCDCGKPVCESCGKKKRKADIDMKSEGNRFSKKLKIARDKDDDEMELDGKKIPVTEFVLSLFNREDGTFPKGETAVLTAIEKDYGEQYIEPAKQFIERIQATFEEFNPGLNENDAEYNQRLQDLIRTGYKGDDMRDALEGIMKADPQFMMWFTKTGQKSPVGDSILDLIYATDETVMEPTVSQDEEMDEGSGLQYHTGVQKHGKEYMDKAAEAGRKGASQEELGRLRDKYSKAEKNKTTKEAQDIMRLAGLI